MAFIIARSYLQPITLDTYRDMGDKRAFRMLGDDPDFATEVLLTINLSRNVVLAYESLFWYNSNI